MRGPIRGVSLHKSLHHGRLTKSNLWFSVGFSGGNSEQTAKQPKEVLSRKHRAHYLNAVPDYWCKIVEHCKQILLPVIQLLTPHGTRTFQSISSRSLTRADEKGSDDNDIGLGYRRRSSVSSSLKSYKTDTPKYYR